MRNSVCDNMVAVSLCSLAMSMHCHVQLALAQLIYEHERAHRRTAPEEHVRHGLI